MSNIQKVRKMIIQEMKNLREEFQRGTKLKFKPSVYREIDHLRKSGTGMEALYGATKYPNDQIYIFKNYDGSTAVVYPEGGSQNDTFRVNKDRFELA